MLFSTPLVVVLASLLSIPAVLSMPKTSADTTLNTQGRAGSIDQTMNQSEVAIHFPPTKPDGPCLVCNSDDGCSPEGSTLMESGISNENGYAWRADSQLEGWWAGKLERHDPHRSYMAIVNNLGAKTHTNMFEIIAFDASESTPALQTHSVWTRVEPGKSCLMTMQGEMSHWPASMSKINVWKRGQRPHRV